MCCTLPCVMPGCLYACPAEPMATQADKDTDLSAFEDAIKKGEVGSRGALGSQNVTSPS